MKKRNSYLLFLLFIGHLSPSFAAQEKTIQDTNPTSEEVKARMDSVNSLVFPETLPTRSIHEQTLDQIYGPQGLNLEQKTLQQIKQTYCYLEFLVKVNKIKTSVNSSQYQQDFNKFLTPPVDGVPMRPTQELVESPSWHNIVVTGDDIKNSPAWQSFVKVMACDCADNKPNFIMGSIAANSQLATFLPNIEMAYPTTEFTDIRLYTESLITQDTMQTELYKNYLAQTTDWKNIGTAKIDSAMTAFKKSDFYIHTHTSPDTQLAGKSITTTLSIDIKELIVAYYMLTNIQQTVFDTITRDNVQLTLFKATSDKLQPNFFSYKLGDLAYLYDYLTVKQIVKNNKENPKKSVITMNPTPADGSMVASSIETIKKTEQAQAKTEQSNDQKSMAEIIFTPELPTTSIFRAQLDQIYGSYGLQIPETQLSNIKKTYCYLEFLVKLDKVKSQPQLARYKNDFNAFLTTSADKPNFPTQTLVTSVGWKSIAVTQDEILASPAWQSFIKAMICKYDQDTKDFIVDSVNTSSIMTTYTSNIEAAYTTNEFTEMRFYTETLQLQQALQKELQQRYLGQCPEWKNLNKEQLAQAMTQFRATDFYTYINPDKDAQVPQDQKAPQISLLVMEQIRSYFMIITIQKNLYEIIKSDNIQAILMQASSTKISPNFFPYQSSDLAYLYDAIMITDLIVQNNEQPITSTFDSLFAENEPQEPSEEVIIQKIKNPFKKSNKAIKDGFNKEIKKPTEEKFVKPTEEKFAKPIDKGFKKDFLPGYISAIKAINTQVGIASEALANAFIVITGDITYGACIMSGNEKLAKKQRARVVKKLKENKGLIMTIYGCVIMQATLPLMIAFAPALLVAYVAGSMLYDERASEPVMKGMMLIIMPILQGLEFLTQNMTTGFIEMSIGLTYTTYYIGQGLANENNPLGAFVKAIAPGAWQKWKDDVAHPARIVEMVRAKMEAYRQTINVVMGVILIAIASAVFIIITGGTFGWGFLIGQLINIGFSVFSLIAAVAADKAALKMVDEERESIQSLWKFVEDNKVNVVQSQKDFSNELHKKHLAAVENNALGLQYYNNFLNGSVNNVQKQIAQVLTQQQIQMLTPDSNGLRMSDIGATWGLQTPFVYLYPSQGFITTTLGRPDFPYAQEVAQAPLTSDKNEVAQTPTDSLLLTKEDTTQSVKLWFNQRAVATLPQSADTPLNVEIRFRFIYNLDASYHVGLYLGGTYHDYNSPAYLESLNNGNLADLNAAHLAKMLIIKRDAKEKSPSVALYEHEGKGWLAKNPINNNVLNNASIYHMSANLDKDKLTVSFWSEDNPSDKWTTTTTVTPCDQRTFGVIFSGAAIQWGVVQPTLKIVENKQARASSNKQSEIDRAKASKAAWQKLLAPSFGLMKLESLGRGALLQGQYLYTTESTKLTDAQGNPTKDYVVYASATADTVTNIGNSPYPPQGSQTVVPNAIISMITGNVYNQTGKIISHVENPWATYTQKKNNIPQAVNAAIAQTAQLYQKQLQEFTFGSYKLSSASPEALNKGLFIYTTSTTLKDKQGNPIADYLVLADLINGALGSRIGMPPSNSIDGMVSLVSGDVYMRTSVKPVDGGYSQLSQYTRQYGQLPPALASKIATSTSAYQATQQTQATPATKTVEVSGIGSQTISLSDLLNAPAPKNGGAQIGLSTAAPSKIISTTQTISQLQSNAAGDANFEFGGTVGLAGFNMSSGFASASPTKKATTTSSPQTQQSSTTSQSSIAQHNTSPAPQNTPPVVTQISNDQFNLAGSSGFSFGGGGSFSTTAAKTTSPARQPQVTVASNSSNQTQQQPVYTQPSPTPQPVNKKPDISNMQEQFSLVGSSGFSF